MKPTLRIVHLFCRLLQRERLNRENVYNGPRDSDQYFKI